MRSWGFVSVWVSSETGIRFLDMTCLNYYFGSPIVTPLIEFYRRGSLIINEGIVGLVNFSCFC